jgi:hypothetical protein
VSTYIRPAQTVEAVQFSTKTPAASGAREVIYHQATEAVYGPVDADTDRLEIRPGDMAVGYAIWTRDGWKLLRDRTWIVRRPSGSVELWEHGKFARTFQAVVTR